ncbi:putative hydroxypyruvate isomerase [Drosophila grimshawi]|uniref:Putative hydroxypyruvate isomerase n=1 Tax=Drosophila grimshawi TaxID=7222 RepID=B4JHR8_DROGR|nr:putative hydroxypyruvate isomerase [Drosophila grimshawi]EDV93907.1 GH18029 [Drosophila grimshawi]
MALKFAANLNFLFTETAAAISERIRLAHRHGFQAVEIPYPSGELQEVKEAINETGILISLMNIALDGTREELKFGSTSIPGEENNFKTQLDKSIAYAKTVNCKKIHLMAGTVDSKLECDHFKTYVSNLKKASDDLQLNNMIGVIEPINKYAIPSYFMNSYEKASNVLREINSDNIKLMVDIYHLQHICGNFTKTLEKNKNVIGHFQIAQVPNRNEPDTPGEINYDYVFETLKMFGYNDWIGCEYKPKTTTVEGLNWISKYNVKT